MGGCLTKQDFIEPNSKVNKIEIKFINIIKKKNKKSKKLNINKIKLGPIIYIKSLNKIPLRKKPRKNNRPPFKYLV